MGLVPAIINSLVQELVYKDSTHARAGGLIALAAASIALGSADVGAFLDMIVPPALSCFSDPDARVRYYACEGMYNVAKVARGDILKYFNELFDALSKNILKLAADSDSSVKTGAELLDRLIKDIVCERSTYYPQDGEISDHPLAAPDDGRGDDEKYRQPYGSELSDLSSADGRRFPADPFVPPAPGSTVLMSGMRPTTFNLVRFIPLLAERIQTVNPSTRMFLVQWIMTLDSVPDLELIGYLPDFMDGLFSYLSDPNVDVRFAALNCLAELLKELQDVVTTQKEKGILNVRGRSGWGATVATPSSVLSPVTPTTTASALDTATTEDSAVNQMEGPRVGPIVPDAVEDRHDDTRSETTPRAISSLSMSSSFYSPAGGGGGRGGAGYGSRTALAGGGASGVVPGAQYVPGQVVVLELGRMMEILLAHLDSEDEETQSTALRWVDRFVELFGEHMLAFVPELAGAILPSLAHSIEPIRGLAMEANANLFRLVSDAQVGATEGAAAGTVAQTSTAFDSSSAVSVGSGGAPGAFDIQSTVDTLTFQFQDENEETRVASMDWLIMLHRKAPKKVLSSDDSSFHALLKALSDTSEEVVRRDLQLLAQISHYSDEEYFMRFMVNLLSLFSSDRRLLETRGALIIRQLCLSLNSERIYRAFAEILERDEDLEFASSMVQNLNIILITAPELSDVRRRLRNLESRDGLVLFAILYRSWCHNAVAAFALCLLAQAYEHAANLLQVFAELEVTVSLLVQVDKLVQLIESPAFTYLRLQLLEPDRHPHLYRCLFGVLMLLPQSSAFVTLNKRLNSVGSMVMLYGAMGPLGQHQQQQQSSTSSYSAPATALSPQLSTSRRSRTSGATSAEPITLRWHELLTHFRNVQLRHERSRRPGYRSSTHPGDRSTSQRRRAGRADADTVGGADSLQRAITPIAGSSPAPMSRSPLPAPHQASPSTLAATATAAAAAARTPSPLLPPDAAPLVPYVVPATTAAAGGSRSAARRRQESTSAASGTPAAAASTLGPPALRAAVTGGVEMGESLSAS
ncbi:hypothetical protein HK405_008636, partial [Cladochytrium tenue]